MNKSTESKEPEPAPKKRGNRYVPLEDVPRPGLSPRSREVLALALCGFSLYAMLCLATFREGLVGDAIPDEGGANLGGAFGYYLAFGFARSLGLAGWVPFLLLLGYAMALFLGKQFDRLVSKALGAVVFAAMLAILFAGSEGYAGIADMTPYGAGGVFGAFVSVRLEATFGGAGRLLFVGFGALVSFLMATEWMFSQLLLRSYAMLEPLWRRLWRMPAAAPVGGAGLAELDDAAPAPAPRRRAPSRTEVAAEERADAEGPSTAAVADDAEPPEAVPTSGRQRRSEEAAERRAERASARTRAEAQGGAAEPDGAVPPEATPAATGVEAGVAVAVAGQAPGAEAAPVAEAPPATPAAAEPPVVLVRPKAKPVRPKVKKKAGQNTLPFDEAYPFPPVELFQEAVLNDLGATSEVLSRGGQAIVQKLANFGIEASIEAASVGPAVTQYELRLAEGVRVNKVVGFESDLAAALKAVSVRVVAPIPGKDTIGIEVPNPQRQKVFMRDLIDQFGRAEDLAIPLFLGKDVAGNPIVEDLARMPHLLIAGTTGSGKSVCINTILLSILMTRTPSQVKLILVDPKMVELQAYKRVPHLCCDVVTNMKKAPSVLQWAVDEMENRYALLSAAGVNHIRNYNRLGQQELEKRMGREVDPERVQLPYIVIVIDEFADLMNVAQNEVEELIQRLAQKSRAVGQHVILATQRPSSEVITGIIKANLPCQIAFKVNRKIDSRVILDANGAEKLLGFGDMLYMPPGGGAMLRAQGTFVAEDEMHAVVKFLEEQGQQPNFNPALMQTQTSSRPSIADSDERYREAVEIVLGQQRGSATLLQRALAVGYTRATRLLELMEEDGLVGPFVGSKSREVLLTLDEWRAREEEMEEALAEVAEDAEAVETADGEAAVDAEEPPKDALAGPADAAGDASAPSAGDGDAERGAAEPTADAEPGERAAGAS